MINTANRDLDLHRCDEADHTNALEYLAHHGRHAEVYERIRRVPEADRAGCHSVLVLSSVVIGGIARVRALQQTAADIDAALLATESDLGRLVRYCTSRSIRPRELYERILDWSVALADMAQTGRALRCLDEADASGVRAYPDLYAQVVLKRAELLSGTGRHSDARQVLAALVERYYLVPDRNLLSRVLLLFGQVSLLTGDARQSAALLFGGLRSFYTHDDIRRLFTDLLCKIHRHPYRVLVRRTIPASDRALFAVHWLHLAVHRSRLGKTLRLDRLIRLAVLALVYYLNYVVWQGRSRHFAATGGLPGGNGKAILVTRAMGGVGDLLMMTPGLHALKQSHPDHEIHVAVPRSYAPLFIGNPDVTVIDIEQDPINVASYGKWFNFTDCPAARIESRTAPEVTMSRADIFARSLGVGGRQYRRMDRRPRYVVTDEEKRFQQRFWKERGLEGRQVIGVQLRSAETYRDYPHMAALVQRLSSEMTVLLLHHEAMDIAARGTVIDTGPLPLRHAFALAAACDGIVAPDSAFVHFAAAFDIPCVALFGPIDGRVRTMHYASCAFVDVRDVLRCVPCWRNEKIPCKLTNLRSSACMENITVESVREALRSVMRRTA